MLHLKLMLICEKRQGGKSTSFTSLWCGLASLVSNCWLPWSGSFLYFLAPSSGCQKLCFASVLSNSGTINSTLFFLSTTGRTLLFIGKVFSLWFNTWNLSMFLLLKTKNKNKLKKPFLSPFPIVFSFLSLSFKLYKELSCNWIPSFYFSLLFGSIFTDFFQGEI